MWGISWSEWLHKLNNWNWSHLDNVLSSIVAVTVLSGIAWATIKLVLNPFSEWLGRRRAQAQVLDQLVCGSSVAFNESLLGVAQFINTEEGREERIYRLRGGWVLIEIKDEAVFAFSITISNPRLYYRTKSLTFGYLNVKLGKSRFGDAGCDFDGERYSIGGRDFGYQRHYYFGNPAGYQDYFLSYNRCGAGIFSGPGAKDGMLRVSGTLGSGFGDENRLPYGEKIDASGITINSLTVTRLVGSREEFLLRNRRGPEETTLRLAQNFRHPTGQTRWQLFQAKYQLTRYRISKALRTIKRK